VSSSTSRPRCFRSSSPGIDDGVVSIHIEEIDAPESLDGPDGVEFAEYLRVRNAVEAGTLGTDLLAPGLPQILSEYQNTPHRVRRHFAARLDGRIVGRALITSRPVTPETGVHLMVDVVPAHRGAGFGTRLADLVEGLAIDAGAPVLKATLPHTFTASGERILAATGVGDVPADDPGARFLRARGYVLEQVARISLLDLAGIGERLGPHRVAAADDYELVEWSGPTPDEHAADVAVLRTGMSTDAPLGGLVMVVDEWDAARVREHDARIAESGRVMHTAAARHATTGRLVGYSEVAVVAENPVATQEDTLVLREHRGHGLGMRLKAATSIALGRVAPHVTAIVTWNAEENRPMLDVNEALGFRAIGYEGSWQKRP